METQQYIDDMQKIQCEILNFLEDNTNEEENFANLETIFADQEITKNRNKFKSLLYLIIHIGNNHYRNPNFFSKLERILQIFKENIKKQFSNHELFHIFESNMRILLFLFDEKLLIFDEYIVKKFKNNINYMQYFAPEIKNFPYEIWKTNRLMILPIFFDDNFFKLRKIGENDKEICNLIRNDMVKEFIVYTNRNNISLNAIIETSTFETNQLLINKKVKLIEYAAFFGSIQIFNYLIRHDVKLKPSLWYFAIHGQNAEIFHELEEHKIRTKKFSYLKCLIESIKCHHNDVANYFLYNFLKNKNDEDLKSITQMILEFYNFTFLKDEFIDESLFYYICKYDYISLVENFLSAAKDIDINEKSDNISLLYYSVEKSHIEVINLLIKNDKLDVNAYNKISSNDEDYYFDDNKIDIELKTALHLAVENENIDIIKLLLTNDSIDVNKYYKKYNNTTSSMLKTALYLAVEKKNIEIIKLLLTNEKIDINLPNIMNNYMETAFYLAVDKRYTEIIKLLLTNKDIDINVPSEEIYYKNDGNGNRQKCKNILNTPLHIAVENSDFEIVTILLQQKNVNIQIKNFDGKTPIECTQNEQMKQLFPQ